MKRLRMGFGCSLVCALLICGACGGGSSGSDGGGGADCPDPAFDNLSGFWLVQETTQSQSCGSELNQFTTSITQTGSTLIFLGRTTFTASMCGSRATNDHPVSVPIVGGSPVPGIRTYSSIVLSFPSSSSFNGTGTWTQTAGSTSCSGTSTFTGTR